MIFEGEGGEEEEVDDNDDDGGDEEEEETSFRNDDALAARQQLDTIIRAPGRCTGTTALLLGALANADRNATQRAIVADALSSIEEPEPATA